MRRLEARYAGQCAGCGGAFGRVTLRRMISTWQTIGACDESCGGGDARP